MSYRRCDRCRVFFTSINLIAFIEYVEIVATEKLKLPHLSTFYGTGISILQNLFQLKFPHWIINNIDSCRDYHEQLFREKKNSYA